MKKIMQTLFVASFVLIGVVLTSSFISDEGEGGRIKVYIVNDCTEDVDFRVESPGSASNYTAYDNSTKPMTFMAGTKIYNSNGDMVHEVTTASEGTKVVVCD